MYIKVDARWPGFNSDEKSMVRKILSGNTSSVSNFAPIRRSGIAPPQAPPVTHSNNISPEGQQRVVSQCSGGSRKTSPKLCPLAATTVNNKSPPASNSSNSGIVR
uniref:Uncharacterized protein n=1 Tax=Parascaris equorum TaxID=6256 RepID=A0A914R768_PAREQ